LTDIGASNGLRRQYFPKGTDLSVHSRRPQVFGVVRPQSGYALRELLVADRDQLDVTFKVRGHNPVSDRVRPRSAQLGDAGSWSAARTAPWRRPRAGGATFAGHRRGEPSCRDIQRTHVVASGSSWPGDPVSSAGQVLTAGPHPPAALPGRVQPGTGHLTRAAFRVATGVRHVPPAAVAVAVDPEGDGVPLDHSMTVGPVADTPVKIRNICYRIADALAMARQRNAGGRPHKGDRKLFSTRLPQDLAARMSAEADELDLTYSDYLANLVAEHFGRGLLVAPAPQLEERLIA